MFGEGCLHIEKPDIPGQSKTGPNGERMVGRLKRSLYGLPSSPRNWYKTYSEYLVKKLGFQQCTHDPCVFYWRKPGGRILFTSIFVDDALIVGDDEMRKEFLDKLGKRFPVNTTETRTADWLLGVKIERDQNGSIHLSQTQAIINLAKACKLDKEPSHIYNSPMSPVKLPKLKEPPDDLDPSKCINGLSFRSVIGSLLFITICVRPDIANAVAILARHSEAPGHAHVRELKRLVCYLYKTKELGITYTKENNTTAQNRLLSFVDADYGGDSDARSSSGYVIIMNGGPITWSSRVQKLTAQSTTEAETIAACDCVKQIVYLRGFLKELGFPEESKHPSLVMEDNNAVIEFAQSLRNRVSAKHYVVKLRFLQESVVRGHVRFTRASTDVQLADMFTKPLPPERFIDLRDQILGIKDIEQLKRMREQHHQ